jgi:hypothetical protein
VRLVPLAGACAGLFLSLVAWSGAARAQDTTVLAPEASAAKAREVIQRTIRALGGPAYLGVTDVTRSGRYTTFEHNGQPRGSIRITDMVKLPDKECIKYTTKVYYGLDVPTPLIDIPMSKTGTSFEVHNGDDGWVLGSGGVIDMAADSLARVRLQRKKDINLLFRSRLNEPEMVLRYGGQDVVDLKFVDWVEASDADRFTIRIAIDHSTHLPVRAIFLFRDSETGDPVEDRDYFSNYRPIQGVTTPMQIAHEHNGYQASQMFFEEVKYNTGLEDSLFTKEALEHLASKSGKRK